jgi:ribosomal-protein-alanine N-acetyltransferase
MPTGRRMWPDEQISSRLKDGIDELVIKDAVVIRRFGPADLDAALEIDQEVFGGYDPNIFAAFYEYHPISTLVAEVDGQVAGFILGFKHMPLEGRIFWLAVRPGYQSRGIGTRLMLEVLKRFRSLGALGATLEVRVSNKKAQALYSSLGFHMIGICPAYYSDGEAAIIMRRKL